MGCGTLHPPGSPSPLKLILRCAPSGCAAELKSRVRVLLQLFEQNGLADLRESFSQLIPSLEARTVWMQMLHGVGDSALYDGRQGISLPHSKARESHHRLRYDLAPLEAPTKRFMPSVAP